MRKELIEELRRVTHVYGEEHRRFGSSDFWICARRDGGIWTEHQARNWREREFRPVVRQVATDFPQFSDLAKTTPYAARHTFISCCLQAGISLASIASWCGTSIQMISQTYGRIISRHEESGAIPLDHQFGSAKAEATALLAVSAAIDSADARQT